MKHNLDDLQEKLRQEAEEYIRIQYPNTDEKRRKELVEEVLEKLAEELEQKRAKEAIEEKQISQKLQPKGEMKIFYKQVIRMEIDHVQPCCEEAKRALDMRMFGSMFSGQLTDSDKKFCSFCGAKINRHEIGKIEAIK